MELDHSRSVKRRSPNGFTLVETLVATAILSGGLMAVTQLVTLSSHSNVLSRDLSLASALAARKLDELMDGDLSSLTPTPADSWMRTDAAAVDYIDSSGSTLTGSGPPPATAVFIRRWSVTAIAGDAAGGVAIQVGVGRLKRQLSGDAADANPSEVARAVAIKTGTVP